MFAMPHTCIKARAKVSNLQQEVNKLVAENFGPQAEQMRSTYTELDPGGNGKVPLWVITLRGIDATETANRSAFLLRKDKELQDAKQQADDACPHAQLG